MAGPVFATAAEYYGLDIDADAVAFAAARTPRLIPVVEDARHTSFDTESIDQVVAHNMFGDPVLHMESSQEKLEYFDECSRLFENDEITKLRTFQQGHERQADHLKDSILQEVARILVRSGSLIIVEDLPTREAAKYLERYHAQGYADSLRIERADLFNITPPNYAAYHLNVSPNLMAWLGTRALQATT